jgi:hypothetical protein
MKIKQIILFALVLIICSYATSFAQSKTPNAVTTAFNQKFPNATNVKWDKENAHEYEASFEWNGEKYSANYSDTGVWLETESPSSFNQLPDKVQAAFNASHNGEIVKAVSKIETSRGEIKYEVEIMKGTKTIELFYLTDGTATKE